jgi:hypothetical protein
VVTSEDGKTFDILVDEENAGDMVKKEKRVKVVVKEDGDGTMHISEEVIDSDEEIYMIKGDDVEKQLKEIMKKVEESDSDNIKIIVIEKDKQ